MEKLISTAKVIDGTLILTLPDAVRPVVWQMQLGQTKSSALEVREEADGNFMLMLKTPRADVIEIAPFSSREKAVKALLAVSRALEKAQGQLSSYSGNAAYPVPALIPCSRFGWLGRLFRGALMILLAFIMLVFLIAGTIWVVSPARDEMDMPSESAETMPTLPEQPASIDQTVGKPVSADDFLNAQ